MSSQYLILIWCISRLFVWMLLGFIASQGYANRVDWQDHLTGLGSSTSICGGSSSSSFYWSAVGAESG